MRVVEGVYGALALFHVAVGDDDHGTIAACLQRLCLQIQVTYQLSASEFVVVSLQINKG